MPEDAFAPVNGTKLRFAASPEYGGQPNSTLGVACSAPTRPRVISAFA